MPGATPMMMPRLSQSCHLAVIVMASHRPTISNAAEQASTARGP